MGGVKLVMGVVTQGRTGLNQYVKSYKVQTSLDSTSWSFVEDGKVFTANTASDNVKVKNMFGSSSRCLVAWTSDAAFHTFFLGLASRSSQ